MGRQVSWALERQKMRYDGPTWCRYVYLAPVGRAIAVVDIHRDMNGRPNGRPFPVHYGVEHRLNAEGLTKAKLVRLFRGKAWQEAFAALCEGHSVEWDGNNDVGRHTEAAQQALINLNDLLDAARRAW
jgi:hypothetical protein